MAEELKPKPAGDSVTIKKWKLITSAVIIVVIAVLVFVFMPKKNSDKAPTKKEPLFNRDEPTKKQILQKDFKEKIHEMLDSGMSVGQISRETGVRRDVIRKIKKEKTGVDEKE
jgi:hypothetical protein